MCHTHRMWDVRLWMCDTYTQCGKLVTPPVSVSLGWIANEGKQQNEKQLQNALQLYKHGILNKLDSTKDCALWDCAHKGISTEE